MAAQVLEWVGPEGGRIGVGFDDGHFGAGRMQAEIDLAGRAYPGLPDRVPPGTRFSFGREATGHLAARFRVGHTVYRGGGREGELHGLWGAVAMIDGLVHSQRPKAAPQDDQDGILEEAPWTRGA